MRPWALRQAEQHGASVMRHVSQSSGVAAAARQKGSMPVRVRGCCCIRAVEMLTGRPSKRAPWPGPRGAGRADAPSWPLPAITDFAAP